ncbi:MAG: DUF1722 domain-containing protein [Tissierellales bacterium]|nr:DUF1722 domain-containing protein [Tissierellales bacterium]
MDWIKPNVFISKCLEHGHCRYDGSQITSSEIKRMEPFINYYYTCPEMDIGLPSPRQALRKILTESGEERLVFSQTGEDITEKMENYCNSKVDELIKLELDGMILKSRSPSCGIKEVKLYKSHGKTQSISNKSKGLFGEKMLKSFPDIMIEDEGRISNFNIREHFLTHIYTRASFREVKRSGAIKKLVKFHSNNKYLFMAYNQGQLKIMGKIVANHEKRPIHELMDEYEKNLSLLLNTFPQKRRNVNVLMHILGYFSNVLTMNEKAYFLDLLQQYSNNQIPVSGLMSVLRMWSIKYDMAYLLDQTIFEPYPKELITVNDSGKGRI